MQSSASFLSTSSSLSTFPPPSLLLHRQLLPFLQFREHINLQLLASAHMQSVHAAVDNRLLGSDEGRMDGRESSIVVQGLSVVRKSFEG